MNLFELTKEDVLNGLCDKIAEACENPARQDSDGEWQGGTNFTSLLNLVVDRIADKVVKELWAEQKRALDKKITDKIDTELSTILNTVFQPVDHWGDKKGAPTTIKDIFAERAKDFWLQKVDAKGSACDGWNAKMTRAEFIAKQHLDAAFKDALAADLGSVMKALKSALHSSLNQVATAEVEKAINTLVKA